MDALKAIATRRSFAKLSSPAPSDNDLQLMLDAAMRAPDHKELRPWRFVIMRNDALPEFGEVNAQALRKREPDATEGQLDKERNKPRRAPVVIAVAAVHIDRKLPFVEVLCSAAAATQNLLLACHALGYGAIWRTGDGAYDPTVNEWLGLAPADQIVGLIYIGTAAGEAPPRQPVDPTLADWRG